MDFCRNRYGRVNSFTATSIAEIELGFLNDANDLDMQRVLKVNHND